MWNLWILRSPIQRGPQDLDRRRDPSRWVWISWHPHFIFQEKLRGSDKFKRKILGLS